MAITFLPFYITTILMVPLLIRQRRRSPEADRPGGVTGANLPSPESAAGARPVGHDVGNHRSLASNGAVLNLMIPVITAVLASFMLPRALTRLRVASLVLGLLGVMLMSVEDLRHVSFST